MRVLLFSDSHGYTQNMVRAVNRCKNVDLIIHLGDFVKDAVKIASMYPGIAIELVTGNNDWIKEFSSEKILDLEGKKILITHGHKYSVKYDYNMLIQKGRSIGADAVFFGHTHRTEEFFSEGMLVLNPGSISVPLQGSPTYCLLEIGGGKIISRYFSA